MRMSKFQVARMLTSSRIKEIERAARAAKKEKPPSEEMEQVKKFFNAMAKSKGGDTA